MQAELPKRKYPRLKNKEIYSKTGTTAHIIIGTYGKEKCFNDTELAGRFCEVLAETAKEKQIKIYAYCVMPNHIHILIESSKEMNIITFVKYIKGRFTSWCRKRKKIVRLQRSFYDHVVRKDEDINTIAMYIIGNPVRAGIVKRFGEYPFAGSLEFNM